MIDRQGYQQKSARDKWESVFGRKAYADSCQYQHAAKDVIGCYLNNKEWRICLQKNCILRLKGN